MSTIFDFQGNRYMADPFEARASDPIVDVQMGQSALVTELILGQPQDMVMPGSRIFRDIATETWQYSIPSMGKEHLKPVNTERAMRAPIKHGDARFTEQERKLRRFSYATLRDEDEIQNSHPLLRLRELMGELSRRMVDMDIVVNNASYAAGHVVTIGGGSEWNSAGGDSRADIRNAANIVAGATGIQPAQLSVFLPQASLEAAKDDPTFLAARQNFDTDIPDEAVLRAYWGVGEVWSANPVEITDLATETVVPMYPDIALVYYRGQRTSGMDTMFGDLDNFVNFGWNRGVASTPWYDPRHTSWFFPWTNYADPVVLNTNTAALIENTST